MLALASASPPALASFFTTVSQHCSHPAPIAVRSSPNVISLPPHLALNSPLSLVRHTVAFAVGAR